MNRRLIFFAGGVVAFAAAAATAHGMYETAVAAGVGTWAAATYPIMFDGQALVAYAATTRLKKAGSRYAWAIVILSAALSGLAQASYLGTGKQLHAPWWLAAGIGYWPAIAWPVTAHLLYLLSRATPPPAAAAGQPTITSDETWADLERLNDHGVNILWETAPPAESRIDPDPVDPPASDPDPVDRPVKAITRAADAATKHAAENGALPTLRELEVIAGVSRGTAVNALKQLKATTNGHHR